MKLSLVTLALGGSLLACSSKPTDKPVSEPEPVEQPTSAAPMVASMVASDRCEAIRDLMVDTVVHQVVAGGMTYTQMPGGMPPAVATSLAEDKMPEPASMPRDMAKQQAGSGTATNAGPSHYTTTNVQEKNVDEGDLVKTDGKFIYTLRNNELVIAKTWPVADTELTARVAFRNLQPTQIYLHGTDVIVHGVATDSVSPYGATRVVVIDVRDRTQPRLARTFDIDGQNASSRVIDGDLYLVQNSALAVPQKLYELAQQQVAQIPRAEQQSLRPWEIQSRLAKSIRTKLLANLATDEIAAALPAIRSAGGKHAMKCADLYMPQDNVQLGITALARITINSQRNDLVGAMVPGGQVYASTESVYVAAPAYAFDARGGAAQQTQIHKFSLTANDGRPTYVATGAVDGTLLNQFSMSEWGGDLRVATTDWNWNGQGGNEGGGNHLFVMRPNGHALKTIGAIRGIAKGEQIYAGRMFGDKGYLVTFRQTDPLFTLDLSDPKNPRVAGELHVNGFSNYIHPLGNDLLLAVGQDADASGRVDGFHMQVFDVSDPAHPTRRFHEKLSSWSNYSTSSAQADHHAFTYDPVTGTLALPVAGTTSDGDAFNALVVYNLDRKRGFTLAGRVTHRQLASELLDANCGVDDPWANSGNCENRRYVIPQYAQIDRSIVVDKYILTLGTAGMEIHSLDHISDRAARLRWPMASDEQPALVVSAQ